MAYVNYRRYPKIRSPQMLGSDLTKMFGSTGAALVIGGLTLGAGYTTAVGTGLLPVGSASDLFSSIGSGISSGASSLWRSVSTSIFGSSGIDTGGYSGVVGASTGIFGTTGLWNTITSAGTAIEGAAVSAGSALLPVVGKVAVAVAPVVVSGAIQSQQQQAAIKASNAQQAASIGLSQETTKKLEDVIGLMKTPTGTIIAGGGVLALFLLLKKHNK